MADKKISALPAATTPLAGTEVLPIVQGGTTDQVSVANLTVGRDIGTKAITTTGNVGVKCTPLSITPLQVSLGTDRRLSTFLNGSDNVLGFLTDAGNWTSTFFTGTPAIFGNGASEAFRIDTNQNIVIKTAAKGIDFSANTHAAGMTSEVLNWYEEGVFTPVFDNLTVGNGSVSGRYTRIGRMVTATIQMEFGSTSAWTGTCANISGLPFTSLYRGNGLITLFRTGVAWYAGQVMIYANQSQTSFPGDANGAAFSALTPWVWGTGDFVVITLTYEV